MIFLQSEAAECGLICLAYAAQNFGAHHELSELRRRFPVSSRGLTLRQISEIAAALGINARGVRCDLEELSALKRPTILHWGLNHFVVLEKVSKHHIEIFDPASGRRRISLAETGKFYTGAALELSAAPGFTKRREKSPLNIWAWMRITPEIYGYLSQVFLLSLVLQAYVIASPFYMQLAIDQAALKGDNDLLLVLAVGFGLFGVFNLLAGLLRSLVMQQVSAHLSWDMGLRLFRHMVRLPLPWFQRRRLADTISRFESINPIRDQVSGALITSFIDGCLAVLTLGMMFVFAWPLALIVLGGGLMVVAVRCASLSTSMRLSSEALVSQIAENGRRIETIKAIQTIKAMSAEHEQETQWANSYADVVRRRVRSTRFTLSVEAVIQGFDVVTSTIVIFFAVRGVMSAEMTVGLVYAFMAYRMQFNSALNSVVAQAIQWKLNDIYSFRLADIVLTPQEEGIDAFEPEKLTFDGTFEIENLSFRYAPYEPFVFKGVNLRVAAGEMLAIIGPSGAGKSTLLKVLAGLYQPSSGEVRLDSRPLSAWGPRNLRRNIGVVMQDDELLSGTVAENVAFFDEQIDMARVWEALEGACLKDEVMKMPMKTETFVGDMGGALSGGQKQRLLIARVLYRRPQILLLDEATSHLDVQNELRVNETLKRLNLTRVVIAHRRETIMAADRIFDISTGKALDRHPNVKPVIS